jgi:hypothetical protein
VRDMQLPCCFLVKRRQEGWVCERYATTMLFFGEETTGGVSVRDVQLPCCFLVKRREEGWVCERCATT